MSAPQQQQMSFYSQQNIPAAQYAQPPYQQGMSYQNMAPQNEAMLYKSPSQPQIQPAGTVQAGQALIYTGQSQFHFKGQPMQPSSQVISHPSDQFMEPYQATNPYQQSGPMGSQPMMTYGGIQPPQNQNYVSIPQANPSAYGGQQQPRNISIKQQTPTRDSLAPMNLPKEPGLEMMSRAPRTSESKIPLAKRVSMQETEVHDPPSFPESLTESMNITEGEVVNLMTSVQPISDSSLNVEWYKDGQPLKSGSRFNNTFDRGYATLDILFAHPEDSGIYTCVATSKYGTCSSTECEITVNPEAQHQQVPDHWSQSASSGLSRFKPGDDSDHYPPPRFLQQLQPHVNLKENAPVHLETKVTPVDDPSLSVEWYKDGKPMSTGCRFNNTFDRGYAILDIYYIYPEDNGLYFCRAASKSGNAQTDPVEIRCISDERVITDSLLCKESIDHLQKFDMPSEDDFYKNYRNRDMVEPDSCPTIDVPLINMTVMEHTPAKFIVKVSGHPVPRISWFISGQKVASTTLQRIYNDGFISCLEILHCNTLGEIKITAVAKNKAGQASSECFLNVVQPQDFRPDLKHVNTAVNRNKKFQILKKVDCSPELDQALKKKKANITDFLKVERETGERGRIMKKHECYETENLYMTTQNMFKKSEGFYSDKEAPNMAPALTHPNQNMLKHVGPQPFQPHNPKVQSNLPELHHVDKSVKHPEMKDGEIPQPIKHTEAPINNIPEQEMNGMSGNQPNEQLMYNQPNMQVQPNMIPPQGMYYQSDSVPQSEQVMQQSPQMVGVPQQQPAVQTGSQAQMVQQPRTRQRQRPQPPQQQMMQQPTQQQMMQQPTQQQMMQQPTQQQMAQQPTQQQMMQQPTQQQMMMQQPTQQQMMMQQPTQQQVMMQQPTQQQMAQQPTQQQMMMQQPTQPPMAQQPTQQQMMMQQPTQQQMRQQPTQQQMAQQPLQQMMQQPTQQQMMQQPTQQQMMQQPTQQQMMRQQPTQQQMAQQPTQQQMAQPTQQQMMRQQPTQPPMAQQPTHQQMMRQQPTQSPMAQQPHQQMMQQSQPPMMMQQPQQQPMAQQQNQQLMYQQQINAQQQQYMIAQQQQLQNTSQQVMPQQRAMTTPQNPQMNPQRPMIPQQQQQMIPQQQQK